MTPTNIVHQRRLAVVTHAIEGGNISETSRLFGVSRTSIHSWIRLFEGYGAEGLRPKDRRPPAQPNATPTWVIDELLRLAVSEPGLGARRCADRLADLGHDISRTTVQNLLNRYQLGRRPQRYAAAARLALFTDGIITDATELKPAEGPYGVLSVGSHPGSVDRVGLFLHRQTQRSRRGMATHRRRHPHPDR